MTPTTLVRWWPPVAIAALLALGCAVGTASTPLDDWFRHAGRRHTSLDTLLIFSDPRVVGTGWLIVLVAALVGRRWRLAAATVVTPVVGFALMRLLKYAFDRRSGGTLAYPSGHITLTTITLGLVVFLAGISAWTVTVAVVAAVLATLGQAVTYHYFTDTVGALLLATALLCVAAVAIGLDRCQPGCDVRHTDG